VYVHQQTLFELYLLSGLLSQSLWLFLRLRAESRQASSAHFWKQRLRENNKERIKLVEDFILEIEGGDHDLTRWSRLADAGGKGNPTEMWKRLDAEWERWLKR